MTKNAYYNLFDLLGLANSINESTGSKEIDSIIRDTIIKTIFYSSKIEGNSLGEEAAVLLINNNFVEKDSIFEDYIELLNHKDLYYLIHNLKDRKVTSEDIIGMQKMLFNNIIGMPVGIRQGPGSVGGHLLKTDKDYYNDIDYSVEILNRQADSKCDALLNAIEFHLRFVSLHPFEDGNGRISRLFMNFYLLKNGMHPLLVSTSEKAPYFNSLAVFHFTDNPEFFTALTVAFYLRDSLGELGGHIKENRKYLSDDYLAFADTLLIYVNKIGSTELQNDINRLLASESNKAKAGALWLTFYANIKDYNIPLTLVNSSDSNLRSLALLVLDNMIDNDFDTYSKIFEYAATGDKDKNVRMVALNVLGYRSKGFKHDIVSKLIEGKDNDIIIQLLNVLHYKHNNRDSLHLIHKLINNEIKDVKVKAYQAFVVNANDNEIVEILNKLYNEDHELLEPVMYRTIRDLSAGKDKSKGNRLNSNIISHELIDIASKNKQVRGFLLRYLSYMDFVNENYISMAENVLKAGDSTDAEKGYCIYILSKSKTYEEIRKSYNIDFDSKNGLVENVALALSYFNNLPEINGVKRIFDINNSQLNEVSAIEISKYIAKNKFGNDFLIAMERELDRVVSMPGRDAFEYRMEYLLLNKLRLLPILRNENKKDTTQKMILSRQ